MDRLIITGCGGAASVGFSRSVKKARPDAYLVGTDCNVFTIPFGENDVKYLVPRANAENYVDKLNEITENENAEFIHAQPDPEVFRLSKDRQKLKAGVFLPSHDAVEVCQDKYKSYLAWKKAGLEMPHTLLIKDEADLHSAFSELKTPFWIRAIRGAGGKGSLIVHDFGQAKSWIQYWKGWGNFVASELLPERLITWQSIWHEGELVCAQTRERLGWALGHSSPTGVSGMTGVARTISRQDVDKISQDAILAIDKKPHGIYGVDMKENKRGVPCPTEINIGRFFTSMQFFTEAGFNMVDIYLSIGKTGKVPKLEKRINPLPENLFWLRCDGSKPKLLSKSELATSFKNNAEFSIDALIKPDSTVRYNV